MKSSKKLSVQDQFQVTEITISYRPEIPNSKRVKISHSKHAYQTALPFFQDTMNLKESFYVMLLNRGHRVLGISKVSEGGIGATYVDPKMIFQVALKANASYLILLHNHPSGSWLPSKEDINLTGQLKRGGEFLQLAVFDHLILTDERYFSFADEGLL